MHDSGIHKNSIVEDTLDLIEAHIDEVLTMHRNLSITSNWTAGRSNIENFWSLIIQILYSFRRISIKFIRDSERNIARLVCWRRNTKNSRRIKKGTSHGCLSKFTGYILGILEFISIDYDFCATSSRPFSWIYIEHLWRSIVVVRNIIISVLLVI